MKRIALAGLLLACGGSDDAPNWPRLETLYRIDAGTVVCEHATSETGDPAGTQYECAWERVLVDGAPACWAVVQFGRPGVAEEWSVSVHRSVATCD